MAPTTLPWSCCVQQPPRRTPASWLCWLLLALLPEAQASGLRIQILEGEGASHRAGSVAYTGATVRIVDTTGSPIPGAIVTFRLPASGVTGTFANGGLAEEVIADEQGKASVWGIRWGTHPGTTNLSITAKVGALTAGTAIRVQVVPASGPAAVRTPEARQQPIQPDPAAAGLEPVTPPPPAPPPHPMPPQQPVSPPPPAATSSIATTVTRAATAGPSFEVAAARPASGPAEPAAARNAAPQPSFEVELAPRTGAPDTGVGDRAALIDSGASGKAGVILGPTLEPVGRIDGPRSKWLWIGIGVAGAIGAGMAYRMMQQRAPIAAAAATVTPTLSLGQPTITIGKP